jgi:hypothetical protein
MFHDAMVHRRRGNVIDIKFRVPPPGATPEERTSAYGDALLATERALSDFRDELSEHTKELIVLRSIVEKELRENKVERVAYDDRLGHIETMVEAVLKRMAIDTLPPMRDKMPTADDIREAVEEAVESAIERKTPATAFQVPGYNPWMPPPAPTGITSDRAKEIVETSEAKKENAGFRSADERRKEMFRGIFVGIAIGVGTPGALLILYLIAKAITATHP